MSGGRGRHAGRRACLKGGRGVLLGAHNGVDLGMLTGGLGRAVGGVSLRVLALLHLIGGAVALYCPGLSGHPSDRLLGIPWPIR